VLKSDRFCDWLSNPGPPVRLSATKPRPLQQLRQLGDVDGDPPRLVAVRRLVGPRKKNPGSAIANGPGSAVWEHRRPELEALLVDTPADLTQFHLFATPKLGSANRSLPRRFASLSKQKK
jgi:hypothetical protein